MKRVAKKRNAGELLIFGNPHKRKKRNAGFGNHKPGCACAFCDRAKKLQAGTIKPPKLNPRRKKTTHRTAKAAPRRSALRRTRRNPDDLQASVKLFQKFHGKDPKEVLEQHVSAAVRENYAALGDLDYLKVVTPAGKEATFSFEGDGVKLASSPDGKTLYCIGGNQNIAPLLEAKSAEKDFIDLGDLIEVQYFARKAHSNFQPVSYYHEFGEQTGEVPRLMFDKLRKQLFIIGGAYTIDTSQKLSPGIEN